MLAIFQESKGCTKLSSEDCTSASGTAVSSEPNLARGLYLGHFGAVGSQCKSCSSSGGGLLGPVQFEHRDTLLSCVLQKLILGLLPIPSDDLLLRALTVQLALKLDSPAGSYYEQVLRLAGEMLGFGHLFLIPA